MATLQSLDESTFEQAVLGSQLPVLVDFYADWCAPCHQLTPILEGLADEFAGKLAVFKVDTERSPRLAQALGVQSLPTMMLFSGGRLAGQQTGVLTADQLREWLTPVLPAPAGEVKPAELAQLISRGVAVPVDLREPSAFGRYRIPGAVNVTPESISANPAVVAPTDGRVRVLYGRSADEAKALVEKLQASGVEVAYLAGGFLHWEADGLDVERG